MRILQVQAVERPTPRLVRVALAGDDLAGFSSVGPADHVKVFLPRPGETVPRTPMLGPDGLVPDDGPRPIGRDYTPRHHRLREGILELDFVLHEGGAASAWAAAAEPGDQLAVAGPRGSHVPVGHFGGLLLVGDETALPAIQNWLRWAPAALPATALIEVQDDHDVQPLETEADLAAQWLTRGDAGPGTTDVLVDALDSITPPGADTFCWVAAETAVAAAVRNRLVEDLGVPADLVHSRGYWKRGASGHEEPHTD